MGDGLADGMDGAKEAWGYLTEGLAGWDPMHGILPSCSVGPGSKKMGPRAGQDEHHRDRHQDRQRDRNMAAKKKEQETSGTAAASSSG